MESSQLIPHLFRTEYSRITAVLCNYLGIDRIQEAEDLASEAFLSALNTWPYRGIPENPVAWLYAVAKNKTHSYLARERTFRDKISVEFRDVANDSPVNIDLSESNITDSQLRMLFAICTPEISPESQIGLALRILCGFGIDEIAIAFLTNRETISKRLFRAREKLRTLKVRLEFPSPDEMNNRLKTVLTTLYLLFNEGYYSETHDAVLREDLCIEAMRLADLLLQNPETSTPEVNALQALMCFHASRFPARRDKSGMPVLYDDQDDSLWDRALITKGIEFLHKSSVGNQLSKYHLEAGIAYWHTIKSDTPEKWENILQLYNYLLTIEYSPIAALNRTWALAKVKGVDAAIQEAEKLQLTENPFYFALLGELYQATDRARAKQCRIEALRLIRTAADRQLIERKLALLENQN